MREAPVLFVYWQRYCQIRGFSCCVHSKQWREPLGNQTNRTKLSSTRHHNIFQILPEANRTFHYQQYYKWSGDAMAVPCKCQKITIFKCCPILEGMKMQLSLLKAAVMNPKLGVKPQHILKKKPKLNMKTHFHLRAASSLCVNRCTHLAWLSLLSHRQQTLGLLDGSSH